jgi:hypothetical protein
MSDESEPQPDHIVGAPNILTAEIWATLTDDERDVLEGVAAYQGGWDWVNRHWRLCLDQAYFIGTI